MGVLRDLGLWFWHLLPANPIMVRVVSTGGKRTQHLLARIIYLVILFAVMLLFGQSLLAQNSSLASLAKQSTQTFMAVSMAQLFMMSFIAPIFTAGAITQEKDSNTLHILLTTPLTNAQIVFGSLLSRLYFVWVLLLAGLPIYCITMIFGGVTSKEIFESAMLAACTALLTGSMAISISVIKVGTRRTILWFFVGVAVYLLAIGALGTGGATDVAEAPVGRLFDKPAQMSWLAPFHPFLALFVVTGQTPAPPPGAMSAYNWFWRWALAAPQYSYATLTSLASVLLVVMSLAFLRKSAKEGEITWYSRVFAFFARTAPGGERKRAPRNVWNDPIAWREAATRASAGGRSAIRWVILVVGVAAGAVLLFAHEKSWWGLSPGAPAKTQAWLTGLLWIDLAVLLLFVASTGATAFTREKESQTMELLLTTPLTSKSIVWGMWRGLVNFILPLAIVPAATLCLFVVADAVRGGSAVTTAESMVLAPGVMVAYASLAAMISLQMSLVSKKTVKALMASVGIIGGGAIVLWLIGLGCGSTAGGPVSAFLKPFLPFPAMELFVDMTSTLRERDNWSGTVSAPSDDTIAAARVARAIGSVISAGVYLLFTWVFYNSMVREFDQIVRKQSA